MTTRSEDIDEDFSEIYKEYTGPPRCTNNNIQMKAQTNKRSLAGSDEEEEPRDPNSVPTDFTSREAKVWEAKSKATERNWKKRKEEEMICKICGESGHFTQGCPSTLGASRKSQDFFERVPARDQRIKALFTEKIVRNIEKDIGCKIKIEEKFIIVSGKDRLILNKGVDAVHKIKEEGNKKGSSSHPTRSRSPELSPVDLKSDRSEPQRLFSSPQNSSQLHHKFGRHEKVMEERVWEDVHKFSRGSSQACGKEGGRSRSSHSKSPGHPSYKGNSCNLYDKHNQTMGAYMNDGWGTERRGSDIQFGHRFEYSAIPQTLEELELEYKREAMELGRIHDKEEDEENIKHREAVREIEESYMKNLALLRAMHAKQWDEFLLNTQKQQHAANRQMSASGFGGYKQSSYHEYETSATNAYFAGANLAMDMKGNYPNDTENCSSSRPHDNYIGLQHRRRDDFGKTYNPY